MKQAIALLIVFIIFNHLNAQQSCIFEVGDSCHVENQNTQIRTSPNYNFKIIDSINDINTEVIAEVLKAKVVNGFVAVRVIIPQAEKSPIGHLDSQEGWVRKKHLECFVSVKKRNINSPSEDWKEDILLAENYKSRKLCKYSKDWHAGLLLNRGRAKYAEENYEGAEADVSKAINIVQYHENLNVFYWYRAHAKSGIGDFAGAIEDFDYILENKEYMETDTCNYTLNEILCWKAQNLYFLDEDYKAKSILNIVIASDSECGFAYYLRGLVKYFINDKPAACEDLQTAAELGFEEAFDEIAAKCQ